MMKHVDEYRNTGVINKIAELIHRSAVRDYAFMEVCGGHTAAIRRFGLASLLPGNIRLISGPGCPVCVTSNDFIDRLVAYSQIKDVIIATFGDMVRIPGSESSLEKERSAGADIRIVFSAPEALEIAKSNPARLIIFPGIGFETTAPGTAVTIKEAVRSGTANFKVLCGHKVMPPAMEALIAGGVKIDGFICPGHVAAVTGSSIFDFIPGKYGIGCVVAGFEPADLMHAVYMLVKQVNDGNPQTEIQYRRAVTTDGNRRALAFMDEVFTRTDVSWRGLGLIPAGGLAIRPEYSSMDAERNIAVTLPVTRENKECICGDILRGVRRPVDCRLFGSACSPETPVGACMVSDEGTCNSYFKYRFNE